jgi:DeoR family transcriptional regulator of aga operon
VYKKIKEYYNDCRELSNHFPIYITSKDVSTMVERHKALVELLRQEGGRMSVTTLSEKLGVSTVTIRQDLRTLAKLKLIERVHGGAVLRFPGPRSTELAFEVRLHEARQEKDAIACFAVRLVKDGYGIALDGSTSAYALVPYLKLLQNLTVVTNSLIIAESFRDTPRNKVLVPAGRIRGESATIVGCPETLPDLNLYFGFFGAWGVSPARGVSDIDPDEVQMREALISRCLKVIILADGRKLGEVAPYTYARLDQVDRVITSDDAPPDLIEQLRGTGISVDVVPAIACNG